MHRVWRILAISATTLVVAGLGLLSIYKVIARPRPIVVVPPSPNAITAPRQRIPVSEAPAEMSAADFLRNVFYPATETGLVGTVQAYREFIRRYPDKDTGIDYRVFEVVRNNAADRKEYREYIERHRGEPGTDAISLAIAIHYFRQGDLDEATRLFKTIETKGRFATGLVTPAGIEALEAAKRRAFEIRRSTYSEDQKLFHLASLFRGEAAQQQWNVLEVTYDSSYSDNLIARVLKEFPHSPWAAEAEFLQLADHEWASHEGGSVQHNRKYISEYESFIKKYPNNSHVADALLRIAQLHFGLSLMDQMPPRMVVLSTANLQHVEAAKETLQRVKNGFPSYADKAGKLELEIDQYVRHVKEARENGQ